MIFFNENADDVRRAGESAIKSSIVNEVEERVKFLHPRISLFDIDSSIRQYVESKWWNVVSDTFGCAYKVQISAQFQPVISRVNLENHAESEIVIIDFAVGETKSEVTGQPNRPSGESDIWTKCDFGVIDNRIRATKSLANHLERIHDGGGVFIIFAAPAPPNEYFVARKLTGRPFEILDEVNETIWSVLPQLDSLHGKSDSGSQITVCDSSELGKVLERYVFGSRFECTFQVDKNSSDEWRPLAKNKYNDAVALVHYSHNSSGLIIVLPQLANKFGFLKELLEDVLPEMVPELFPDVAKGKWTHRKEYELASILQLENEKMRIEREVRETIAKLDAEIIAERAKNSWLHDLITESGDPLVSAVKKALSVIGFEKVVDIDEIRDKESKKRREDLQIQDISPLLVVDIKGVGGTAVDEDVTQANKHTLLNIRELNRVDVKALSIINQQRHLPALERNNETPFRKEMLDIADETNLGLMTTFDLYKILLNMQKNGWRSEHIKPLFYEKGRIGILPIHYRCIGKIGMVMIGKFGVVVEGEDVCVGDTIAIGGDIFFEEQLVDSIQIDRESKQKVTNGDRAGFVWLNNAFKLKEGMPVYRVSKE